MKFSVAIFAAAALPFALASPVSEVKARQLSLSGITGILSDLGLGDITDLVCTDVGTACTSAIAGAADAAGTCTGVSTAVTALSGTVSGLADVGSILTTVSDLVPFGLCVPTSLTATA